MKYKIVRADPFIGAIEVLFTDSEEREFSLNINLPIDVNGSTPTGQKLEELISQHAPHAYFERMSLAKSTQFDGLVGLVGLIGGDEEPMTEVKASNSDVAINPLMAEIVKLRKDALTKMSDEEKDEYVSGYMAALDEFHGKNSKWAQLGYLEKARCINVYFNNGSRLDREVATNNIFQLIEIAKVHESS